MIFGGNCDIKKVFIPGPREEHNKKTAPVTIACGKKLLARIFHELGLPVEEL